MGVDTMYEVSTVWRQPGNGVYGCYECRHGCVVLDTVSTLFGWCQQCVDMGVCARYSVDTVWVVSTVCRQPGDEVYGCYECRHGCVVLDTVSTLFGWCQRCVDSREMKYTGVTNVGMGVWC